MDLDLRKVRYFVAVAERLHFRRAAEELHIAQPALSRQVAALERELGVTLLARDKRSVALTAAGRQLLEESGPLLAAADAARRRTQRAERGTRRLVVGFRAGIVPTPAIRALTASRPELTVEVRRMEWDDQEQLLLSGAVDIAYVRAPIAPRGLRLVPLFSEPRLVALPAEHALAGAATLTEAELAGERHLRYLDPAPGERAADERAPGERAAPDTLAAGAAAVSPTTRLRSVEEKLEHVAAGHGIILLPRSATRYYSRPDVVYVPVTDAEPDRVWLASEATRRSKLLNAFLAAARETLPEDVERSSA